MILKNIFGKTVEAAKKTAYQMYGNDILILETSEPSKIGSEAKITIFSDTQINTSSSTTSTTKTVQHTKNDDVEGVQFDRSNTLSAESLGNSKSNLMSIRKYATEQILLEKKKKNDGLVESKYSSSSNEDLNEEKNSQQYYNRKNLLHPKISIDQQNFNNQTPASVLSTSNGKFITHFREAKPKVEIGDSRLNVQSPIQNQKAIKALHKRFDKLEKLFDTSLISANLDYASHPLFQQLVKTGINTTTISGWFSEIISFGIDPFEHNELFMTKLAKILRNSLSKTSSKEPSPFMLFVGPSGVGKTTLIMKLCLHPDFMLNKKVAVACIHPQQNVENAYFSILKPFCRAENISYFEVKKGLDVGDYLKEWKEFDHVLIDSPSLSIEHEESFREYWKLRQLLTPLTPLEVHFVVNAARSKYYFTNTSAKNHPMQPDYISITHLDEISQWGPLIPFMKEMNCAARYISTGSILPTSLGEFKPQWFAQKILEI